MNLLKIAKYSFLQIPKRTILVGNKTKKVNSVNSLVTPSEQIKRDKTDSLDFFKNKKWVAVYRYPGIRFAVLLARAKLVQTTASVLYLPYSSYQYYTEQVDSTWFYTCASLAVLAPAMLIMFSRYLNRLIGVISMDETNEFVRIGYLTFWGSRKNLYLELTDILSLSEVGNVNKEKMVKFMWFSGGAQYLYLPIKNAEIVDINRAEILFGDISAFDISKNQ